MALRKYYLIILSAFLLMGAAPSRTKTYTAGTVINPTDVTENEDNIFSYLQAGVDTYKASSVDSTALGSASVTNSKLGNDAVKSANIFDDTIETGDIKDNTVTATDLAATQTFADGDLIDLSAINASSASEGLKIPIATNCASSTATGQLCWDSTSKILKVGDSSTSNTSGHQSNIITVNCNSCTGATAYTGMGFKPLSLWLYCSMSGGGAAYSIGAADDDANGASMRRNASSWNIDTSNIAVVDDNAGNSETGSLTSYDSDGFTITWTKAGTQNVTCFALGAR